MVERSRTDGRSGGGNPRPAIPDDADARWLMKLDGAARAALLRAVKDGDVQLAMKVLERLDPSFRLPQQCLDITSGGRPIALVIVAGTEASRVLDRKQVNRLLRAALAEVGWIAGPEPPGRDLGDPSGAQQGLVAPGISGCASLAPSPDTENPFAGTA